jgi:hypothetical protein
MGAEIRCPPVVLQIGITRESKFDLYAMRLQQPHPSSKGNPVTYALGGRLPTDERPDDERKWVENQAGGSGGDIEAA